MPAGSLILRVVSKIGRSRIQCSAASTLGDLKRLIRERLSLSTTDSLGLTLEPNGHRPLIDDKKTLEALGVQDGARIFTHWGYMAPTEALMTDSGRPQQRSRDDNVSVISTNPVNSTSGNQSTMGGKGEASLACQKPSTSRRKKPRNAAENENTRYKPFEAFLEDINYDVSDLPLVKNLLPVKKRVGFSTPLPPTLTLKRQGYRHVDQVEVMNMPEVSNFVMHWRSDLEMLSQRAGFLFGYYVDDEHYGSGGTRAVVEAVLEPLQVSGADAVEIVDDASDASLAFAKRIAQRLGLELVGWVFTHLPRDKLITANEALTMGRLQLENMHMNKHYTGYPVSTFVTMTVSAKEALKGEAGPDVFMISDQGLAMIRDGLLEAPESDSHGSHIHIRKADKAELMPTILESTQIVEKFDCDWLLLRVNEAAPIEPRCLFKRSSFPKTNRSAATLKDVSTFLKNAPSGLRPWEKVADFHFLIFVAKTLGIESAETLCDCILNKEPVDGTFLHLLENLAEDEAM